MGRLHGDLKAGGTDVLVIGGADEATAARIAQTFELPFPVLADEDLTVYRRYGLADTAQIIRRWGTFLVDRDGIVRYANPVQDPQKSFRRSELLAAVADLPPG